MTAPARSESRRATKQIGVRVTPEQYEQLAADAAKHGKSIQELLLLGWTWLSLVDLTDPAGGYPPHAQKHGENDPYSLDNEGTIKP